MSCCGERRAQLQTASPIRRRPALKAADGRVIFEYTGHGPAVVKGAVTGRGYGFVGYGARVAVDARDAPSLTQVPYVQRVLR